MGAMVRLFHLAYRLFGDRMRVQGRPLAELETVGARSGRSRRTVLGTFPGSGEEAAGGLLVVASNGDSGRHPAWLLNLAKHPDQVWITVSRHRLRVRPEPLAGEDRERAWRQIPAPAPGYAGYRRGTDRLIPVVRPTPEEGERS